MNKIILAMVALVVFGGVAMAEEAKVSPVTPPTPEAAAAEAGKVASATSLIRSAHEAERQIEVTRRSGLTFGAARREDAGRLTAAVSSADSWVLGLAASPFQYGEEQFKALAALATPAADTASAERLEKREKEILEQHGLLEKKAAETK